MNYEESKRYSLKIIATDPQGLFDELLYNVEVINVNDPPQLTLPEVDWFVNELAPGGTSINPPIVGEDEDFGTSLTFEIADCQPSNPFVLYPIGQFSTRLMVVYSDQLDYEAIDGEAFQLTIRITDDGINGNTTLAQVAEETITVYLHDVNEAPSIPSGQTASVAENTPLATMIGDDEGDAFVANDPDIKTDAFSALTWEHTQVSDLIQFDSI